MLTASILIILAAYLSLVIELTLFPVPSVASTYQLTHEVRPSSSGSEQKGALMEVRKWSITKKTIFLLLPALINICVFLLPLILLLQPRWVDYLFPIPIAPSIGRNIGLSLLLFGRLLTFGSVLKIRKSNSQQGGDFKLHEKGLFAWSRNPGLVGMFTMIIGLLFIFPSWIFLIGILFYICYMHYKVLLEEDFLSIQFGKNYGMYKASTRRYV